MISFVSDDFLPLSLSLLFLLGGKSGRAYFGAFVVDGADNQADLGVAVSQQLRLVHH